MICAGGRCCVAWRPVDRIRSGGGAGYGRCVVIPGPSPASRGREGSPPCLQACKIAPRAGKRPCEAKGDGSCRESSSVRRPERGPRSIACSESSRPGSYKARLEQGLHHESRPLPSPCPKPAWPGRKSERRSASRSSVTVP